MHQRFSSPAVGPDYGMDLTPAPCWLGRCESVPPQAAFGVPVPEHLMMRSVHIAQCFEMEKPVTLLRLACSMGQWNFCGAGRHNCLLPANFGRIVLQGKLGGVNTCVPQVQGGCGQWTGRTERDGGKRILVSSFTLTKPCTNQNPFLHGTRGQ